MLMWGHWEYHRSVIRFVGRPCFTAQFSVSFSIPPKERHKLYSMCTFFQQIMGNLPTQVVTAHVPTEDGSYACLHSSNLTAVWHHDSMKIAKLLILTKMKKPQVANQTKMLTFSKHITTPNAITLPNPTKTELGTSAKDAFSFGGKGC